MFTDQRLEDREQEDVLKVEDEWGRRAKGARPWTTAEYLDQVAAVHAKYKTIRLASTRWDW